MFQNEVFYDLFQLKKSLEVEHIKNEHYNKCDKIIYVKSAEKSKINRNLECIEMISVLPQCPFQLNFVFANQSRCLRDFDN